MAGIATAESGRHKKAPKVLHHLEIHPKMGGGHIITHHYHGYEHPPEEKHFEEDEGHKALAHIAKHAGLPHEKVEEQEDSEPEPFE